MRPTTGLTTSSDPKSSSSPTLRLSANPRLPAVYQEPSRGDIPALPLLALVIGLAGAAIWFVGIPHLTKAAPVDRGCEVIVLKTGKTKCVANPRAGSNAPQSKPAK